MKQKFYILLCCVLSCQLSTKAQVLASTETTKSIEIIENPAKNAWAIFTDAERKVIYIDFEKIPVNVSEILVRDAQNKILFDDTTVWELPVNTIYEVDFAAFPKGEYIVEVRAFTGAIAKRTISIK